MQKQFYHYLILMLVFCGACQESKKENNTQDYKPAAVLTKSPAEVPIQKVADKKYQGIALFLAGIKQEEETELSALEKNQAWKDYARQADASWAGFNNNKLKKMTGWADSELKEVRENTKTIFYPFSGPDFLNVHTFFPSSNKYIMIGLEPIGLIPDVKKIPKDSLPAYFHAVQQSLFSILNLSFFKTIDMAVDFKSEQLDGIVADLFIFIVRTGNKIIAVHPITIIEGGHVSEGSYVSASHANKNNVYGLEITFETKDAIQRTLHYFSADLWDRSLSNHPEFLQYLKNQGEVTGYLKSASYLMHKEYFSIVRGLMLNQAKYLLQDDSGIPYRFFVPAKWDVTLYGSYNKPINLFKDWFQEDLKKAYQDSSQKIKSLNFGIGYNFQVSESNLMLIRNNKK
jgi:hypothetical protein